MVRTIPFILAILAFSAELSSMSILARRAAASVGGSKDVVASLTRNMSNLSVREMNPFKKKCCVPEGEVEQAAANFDRAMLEFRTALPAELKAKFKELQVSVFAALRKNSKEFCQQRYLDDLHSLTEAVTESAYPAAVVQMGAFLVRVGAHNVTDMVRRVLGPGSRGGCAYSMAEVATSLEEMREAVNECTVDQSIKDEFAAVIREWHDGQCIHHAACPGHFLAIMDNAVLECLRMDEENAAVSQASSSTGPASAREKADCRAAQRYEDRRRYPNSKNLPFRRATGKRR